MRPLVDTAIQIAAAFDGEIVGCSVVELPAQTPLVRGSHLRGSRNGGSSSGSRSTRPVTTRSRSAG